MAISFNDIYKKAIGLFDDPDIKVAFDTNIIKFEKWMYVYMQNSISLFNNPSSVAFELTDYEEPIGTMETFEGDGVTTTFTLDSDFKLIEGSKYEFMADGKPVHAKLNKETRQVEFDMVLSEGKTYSVEQYFCGSFKTDFTGLSGDPKVLFNINAQVKDILARLLVKSWAEETRNFLLDIQNILTDTDFKLHPASAALRSKNEWVKQLDAEILQYQNKLAWVLKFAKEQGRG